MSSAKKHHPFCAAGKNPKRPCACDEIRAHRERTLGKPMGTKKTVDVGERIAKALDALVRLGEQNAVLYAKNTKLAENNYKLALESREESKKMAEVVAEATRLQQEGLDTIRNPDPATELKAARIRERAFQSVQAESAHGMLGGTDEACELAELRAMRSRIHGVMAETLSDLDVSGSYPRSRAAIQAVFDDTRVLRTDGAAVIALERGGPSRRGAKKRGRP